MTQDLEISKQDKVFIKRVSRIGNGSHVLLPVSCKNKVAFIVVPFEPMDADFIASWKRRENLKVN